MTKIKNAVEVLIATLKGLATDPVGTVRRLYQEEPAVTISLVVSAVLVATSKLGIVLDEQSATDLVGEVLLVLLGGAKVRSRVSPTA